ncbi:basic secretory protein-like protein [Pirellulaceae bacterium SH449]
MQRQHRRKTLAVIFPLCALAAFLSGTSSLAIDVIIERSSDSSFFQFPNIPPPALNDSASTGNWAVARGRIDSNSLGLVALSDGKIPSTEDSPKENFFFASGSRAKSLAVDLGKPTELAEVVVYSWHPGVRASQVYTLYGAEGSNDSFSWNRLDDSVDPEAAGWIKIADVDTREEGVVGGQHASRITASESLGTYRYLLFDIQSTDARDPFGNTFFSEIDVVSEEIKDLKRIELPRTELLEFASDDGRFRYSVDLTAAPNMAEWTEKDLKPIILQWYPKIVELLPSENFTATEKVRFRYQPNSTMNGTPAYAQGGMITLNTEWMARERNREAKGAVVHEMAHVVQSYQGRRERGVRRSPTPGWIVEGIPDYIRWFLYEPQSQGAKLGRAALAQAKHDASYRVSANFIDWVIRTYDQDGSLLRELNAAAREGRYTADIWLKLTGKSELELADQWRNQ